MTLSMELDDEVAVVGGAFSGRLIREHDGTEKGLRARAVRLSLKFSTEGRGDTHQKTLHTFEFPLGDDGRLDESFVFEVPADAPISYDGSLIRVVWEIEARIDLKLARDPKTERTVLVVPEGGAGLYVAPHPLSVYTADARE